MSNGMPPMDELLKQLSGKLDAMNRARDRATPQQARTVADDSSAYPWLKADVRTALSLSNAPVAVKNSVAQSAAQAALRAGAAHVTDAVKGVTSKLNTKSHFSWTSPGDIIRTTSRYATGALMAPLEMASNMVGAQLGVLNKYAPKTGPLSHGSTMPWNPLAPVIAGGNALIHGKGGSFVKDMAKTEKHAIWDTTFGAEGTTLASAVNQPFAAQGHGYFMSQQVAEAQGQKAKEIRGTTEGGHAWTMGRYLGQDLINSHLVKDENAGAYNVVSGLTDMAATWYLDPMQLSKASRAPIAAEEVTAKAKGFGRIGNAIMDQRRASEAAVSSRAGTMVNEARSALTPALEGVAAAETHLADVADVVKASGGGGSIALKTAAEGVAKAEATASEYRKVMAEAVGKAENFAGIDKAMAENLGRNKMLSLFGKGDMTYAEAVRSGAGLVDNPKTGKQIASTSTMKWLLSKDGQRVVQILAEEESPTVIHALTKGRLGVKAATEVAAATTAEEVVMALAKGLTIEGGARTPTISRFGNLKVGIGQSSRALGQMAKEGDAFVNLSKPEQVVEKVFNLLGNARVVGAERNAITDDLMKALATENQGVIHYALRGMHGNLNLTSEIKKTTALIKEGSALGQSAEELASHVAYLQQLEEAQQITGHFGKAQQAIQDAVDKTTTIRSKLHSKDFDSIMLENPTKEVGKFNAYTSEVMSNLDPQFSKFDEGPLRFSQLANDGVFLMDPAKVREVDTEVSRLSPLLLGSNGSIRRMPLDMAQAYQERVWRVPTILRPALAIRMLGEEVIRATLGGGFRGTGDIAASFVRAGGFKGFKGLDALGNSLDAPAEISRLRKLITEAELVAGKEDEVAAMRSQIVALEESYQKGKRTLAEATQGKRAQRGLLDSIEQKLGARHDQMVSTGQWAPALKDDPRQINRFRLAAGDELISQAADPVYKRLANGGLIPGDMIEPGRRLEQGVPTSIDDIEKWLAVGSGRQYWAEYAANKNLDVNDATELRTWLAAQHADLMHHFGNDEEALRAIATGDLRGSRIVQPNQFGRSPHSDEMTAWAKDYHKADYSPKTLRYEMTLKDLRNSADPKHKRAIENYDRLTASIFTAMYSNKSDRLLRAPMFSKRYWGHMEGMVQKLSPAEAMRVAENAAKDPLMSAEQLQRIQNLAHGATGTSLLDDADQLAKGWAIDDVKKLFYKADRDPRLTDKARVVFPFARAFAEVMTTWGRIIAQDPASIAHTADITMRGLRQSGVFHRDENGNEVFTIPMTGQLAELVTGVNAPMTGSVKGLNIVGSVLPGVGPVASIPGYFIAQNTPLPSSMTSLLFPFGSPKSIEETIVPGWLSKIRSGWNQQEQEQVYGTAYFRVVQHLMASGEYANTPDDQARLLEDAKGKAGALTALRGIVQAFSPSAPIVNYVANTDQGDVTVAKMAKDFQHMVQNPGEVHAAGFDSADEMFLKKYGERNVAYLVSRTSSNKTGASPNDEFIDWRKTDGAHAMSAYPEVYGYIGPHPDTFSLNAFSQLVESGDRTPRTANDLIAEANNKLANNLWYDYKASQAQRFPNPTKAQQKQLAELEKKAKADLTEQFPGWAGAAEVSGAKVKAKAAWLEKMAADPKLDDNVTVQHLRTYYQNRTTALAAAQKLGVKTLTAQKASGIREWLTQGALALAKDDPGFGAAWTDILSREF